MLVLTIRTDQPEAEVGLFDGDTKLTYQTWAAHRELSTTIHRKIEGVLQEHDRSVHDIEGIVCFQGPGSFTGLRIGLTVANALAYGLQVPIVATMEDKWVRTGLQLLESGQDDRIAMPHYGAPVHITIQKK